MNTIEKFYTAKYNRVFKDIFCDEDDWSMLEQLLHNILKIDIYSIEFLNNENVKEKGKTIDSLIKVNDKIYVNMEVNMCKDKIIDFRNLVYFYHIISTKAGRKKSNKDESFIHIDFSYGLDNSVGEVEEYKERNEKSTLEYVDSIKIIEFNMDKITNFWYSKDENKIKKYKYLIMLNLEKEELEKLCLKFKGDEFIMKFKRKCEKLNSNETYRSFLTPEEDQMFLRNSYIDEGIEIGEERGRKEGKKEGKLDVAKNMLKEGISIALIKKCTNLSEQQIAELQ